MTQNPRAAKSPGRRIPPGWQDPLRQQQPLVSQQWLIRTFAISLGAALFCAYLTLCLLFYQGRWQVLFHPSPSVAATPANFAMRCEDVQFDSTETGQQQLTGWWIPADPGAIYSGATVLYLHGASGSLADTLPHLKFLHSLGINIFAFDYRGFGHSSSVHPSETSVYEDADAAFAYLMDMRKLRINNLVLYGEGLGATIAAEVALRHPQVAALIVQDPVPPALEQIAADRRTALLPIRLLFADRFDLASKLKSLSTPILFAQTQTTAHGQGAPAKIDALYRLAPEPKVILRSRGELDSNGILKFMNDSLSRR